MIPITPDMIGPGIEEEYADLKPRVNFLLEVWKDHPPGNDTAHGRIVLFLLWLRQELAAKHIPIPLDRSYLGTIKYLVGSGDVGGSLPVNTALEEISGILQGRSLIKRRHIPVVVLMIDEFVTAMHQTHPNIMNDTFLLELQQKRNDLATGQLALPLPDAEERRFQQVWVSSRYLHPIPGGPLDLAAHKMSSRIMSTFFGRRPYLLAKPPMPAPCPGLQKVASDISM